MASWQPEFVEQYRPGESKSLTVRAIDREDFRINLTDTDTD
jgi:hypothetical protein